MQKRIRVGDEVIVTGGHYIMTTKGTIGIIVNIAGNRGLLRFKHKNGSMQQCNVRLEYLAIHVPEIVDIVLHPWLGGYAELFDLEDDEIEYLNDEFPDESYSQADTEKIKLLEYFWKFDLSYDFIEYHEMSLDELKTYKDKFDGVVIPEEPNIEKLETSDPIDEQEEEELEAAAEADLTADIDPDEAINYDEEIERLEGKSVIELKEICKINEYTKYTALNKNQLVLFIMGGGVK